MIGDLGFELTNDALGDKEHRSAALAGVAKCVLGNIERAYPVSERQTLNSDDDLELPRHRFSAFYGSFDWHSCVHSHWTLVRMLRKGCLPAQLEYEAAAQLGRTFSPELIGAEAESWRTKVPAYEEKPYGWTWFLELDAELGRLASQEGNAYSALAREWREAAAGLTAEMRRRVDAWLSSIAVAARTGTHPDTAWNLAMTWDYARSMNDDGLKALVEETARRLYGRDRLAPVAYEPNADTFTSAIMNEAACMARCLPADEFATWLECFFPQLFDGRFESPLVPDMPGRWNGEGYLEVHQVALPTSKGLAARDVASALTGSDAAAAREALVGEASRWLVQGVEDVQLSGYLAEHWVGSFVCAALLGA